MAVLRSRFLRSRAATASAVSSSLKVSRPANVDSVSLVHSKEYGMSDHFLSVAVGVLSHAAVSLSTISGVLCSEVVSFMCLSVCARTKYGKLGYSANSGNVS